MDAGEAMDAGDACLNPYVGDVNATSAADLDVLVGVDCLDGDLWIHDSALSDLSQLGALEDVTGELKIEINASLTSLSGLENLAAAGRLVVRDHAALSSLAALGALEVVDGDVFIMRNAALSDLTGLDALEVIGGGMQIDNNDGLADLTGLGALESVGDFFAVQSEDSLTSLDGLDALQTIDGELFLGGLPNLASIAALSSLTTLGALEIGACPGLTSLGGLENIDAMLPGGITLSGTMQLTDFTAIAHVTDLGGELFLTQIDFVDLSMFASLVSIGGLRLESTGITSLGGMTALAEISGDVILGDNQMLATLGSFDELTTIGGELEVAVNFNLVSSGSFPLLTSIGSDLVLSSNGLTEVDGFGALDSVGGNLTVNGNGSLPDLDGFDALMSVGGTTLSITGNAVLPASEAQDLIDRLTTSGGFTGTASNTGNNG